ncbi:hypothetical protein HELRODRAFT_165917 [Helobdella robusta]|uniref:G-protein coupled receptors family 1 profile domain-containing protein n=1 Tax=Helobdella robusta TaxID=6412 RepID=T1EXG2_HELRO|nr:hypothetical protein HELRODRAFT_165917 [Helobdella robusta]ESN90274.1 hypothetical protein HELRODRAFT_165917 [Helobdella robusta]
MKKDGDVCNPICIRVEIVNLLLLCLSHTAFLSWSCRWIQVSPRNFETSSEHCPHSMLAVRIPNTSASYTHYRMPYGRPLTDVCSNTGVWLTVTFTFERYIGVQYPIKGRIWCTCERARKLVGVVFTVALLLTLPEFFEKKASYYSYYSSRLEQNVTRCNVTDREVVANLLKSLGYYKMNQESDCLVSYKF